MGKLINTESREPKKAKCNKAKNVETDNKEQQEENVKTITKDGRARKAAKDKEGLAESPTT